MACIDADAFCPDPYRSTDLSSNCNYRAENRLLPCSNDAASSPAHCRRRSGIATRQEQIDMGMRSRGRRATDRHPPWSIANNCLHGRCGGLRLSSPCSRLSPTPAERRRYLNVRTGIIAGSGASTRPCRLKPPMYCANAASAGRPLPGHPDHGQYRIRLPGDPLQDQGRELLDIIGLLHQCPVSATRWNKSSWASGMVFAGGGAYTGRWLPGSMPWAPSLPGNDTPEGYLQGTMPTANGLSSPAVAWHADGGGMERAGSAGQDLRGDWSATAPI